MEVRNLSLIMVDSHNEWLGEMPPHSVRAHDTNEDQAAVH
jgi:hypothetical protein